MPVTRKFRTCPMPRNMSFMITTAQMYGRTKTVTRRTGWKNLKPGDKLWAVEKGQGLKKGEKIKRICMIEVTHVRFESLNSILQSDCTLEGFPSMDRLEFIDMFIKSHKEVSHFTQITRIEYKFIEEEK